MKKIYVIVSSVLIFSGIVIFAPDAKSNQSGAVSNYSGVNSALGTCAKSGCHSGGANTGPGNVSISSNIPGTGYIAGQTYQLTVTVASGGNNGNAFGFALSGAKTGSSVIAGTFANTDNSAQPKSSGQYVTHTLAGTANGGNTVSRSFVVDWTAPAAGSGAVTFFAAGNSANGNGANSGDNIYTGTLAISEDMSTVSLEENQQNRIEVFPNPVSDLVSIRNAASADWTLKVTDLTGKTLVSRRVSAPQYLLDLSALPGGMYLLQVESGNTSVLKKIIVQ